MPTAKAADPYAYDGDGASWSTAAGATAKDWTGPYVGLNGGVGLGSAGGATSGFLGGLTAGANWQTGQAVFGAEGDLDYGDVGRTNFASRYDERWLGTIRGRIGYAFGRFVAYGTGGLAWTSATLENSLGGNASNAHLGWTIGAGLEAAVTDTVSLKAEYLFAAFNDAGYSPAGGSIAPTVNLLRIGANYHF
jgi:outer membrane immunogenic protein